MGTLSVNQSRTLERKRVLDSTVAGTTAALIALKAAKPDLPSRWKLPRSQQFPRSSRLLRWIWSQHRNRKVADFLWLLSHRRLSVGERRTWSDDPGCHCGRDMETHLHLFKDCKIVAKVRRWFADCWHHTTGRHLSSALFGSLPPTRCTEQSKAYWQLLSLAYPELLYAVWLQRCTATFEDEPFSAVVMIAIFLYRLNRALEVAVRLKAIPGFEELAEKLCTKCAATSV